MRVKEDLNLLGEMKVKCTNLNSVQIPCSPVLVRFALSIVVEHAC